MAVDYSLRDAFNAVLASRIGANGLFSVLDGFKRTDAEIAALVTPTNFTVPSHLQVGVVLPERYGGAGDNSTLNDTAHNNSLAVAYRIGDGVVQYGEGSTGIWKFAAPITIGVGAQGRRVVGAGWPEFNFAAGIANTLDLVTLYANVSAGPYADQPQFDNIQVACNGGGRYGVVLKGGNRPLLRNLRISYSGSDSYAEVVTAPDWIEKAERSILVRFAGRHGWRQELLGAAGTAPYINAGSGFVEVRGVSAITAGGTGRYVTGDAGLGAAAKVSDDRTATLFDAIYTTSGAYISQVPATSPMIVNVVTVANEFLFNPQWENTGNGGNPGAGPLIKLTNGGTWAGFPFVPNWNSLWGDGTLDPGITAFNRLGDLSFPALNSLYGKLSLRGNVDNQTVLALTGQTTTGTQGDLTITRTGAAVNAVGQGANVILQNSTGSTSVEIAEYNGEFVIRTFSAGAWAERARILPAGGVRIFNFSAVYSGTGVPGAGLGANGDFYLRQDGGAGTCIYQKRAGAWVATAA